MGELSTPKQRASAALKIVRYMIRGERRKARDDEQNTSSNSKSSSKSVRKIDRILNRATKAVFKKADLNINDNEDWKFLLPWLAWAIYGKNPGHPKTWNKRELLRLLTDVAALQLKKPNLIKSACCAELIKNNLHYLGMGVTAATLRRRLQEAKKLNTKPKA